MLKNFSFSNSRRQFCRGWTLVETLVSLFGGSAIMATLATTGSSVTNTMVAIMNYNDLNKASRNTLDVMSRDLRNTAVVTAITSNQVTVTNSITGDRISYVWDGTNCLSRTLNGVSQVMLTGCDTLVFYGYQRNPTTNLQFLASSTPAQTKLISVSWRCSRQILGAKLNTESVQTAQICIRN
jgi:type II secretory pathway component PulJ